MHFQLFSIAVANASSDNDRNRLRRIPRSTSFETIGSEGDPAEVHRFGQLLKLSLDIGVADELRRARIEEGQILQQAIKRAQQFFDFVSTISSGAEGLSDLEKFAVVRPSDRCIEDGQGLSSCGGVAGEIKFASGAHSAV